MPFRQRFFASAAHWVVLCCAALLAASARADEGSDIRLLLARGELPAALARAEAATKAQPGDSQMRFLFGVVLMDLQRNAQALEVFSGMSQDFPELPEPFNNIALLQVRLGQPELARLALDTALRNDPGHRQARLNLAQVHLMLAAQALQLAATAAPADREVLQKLQAVRALLALPGR